MSTSTSVLICQMGMTATHAASFEVEAVLQTKELPLSLLYIEK
jgi:antitoxin component of RelBE/YafQ-DinJ toxin-antitoxin module